MKIAILLLLLAPVAGCVTPQEYEGCAKVCGAAGVRKVFWHGGCECNPPRVRE